MFSALKQKLRSPQQPQNGHHADGGPSTALPASSSGPIGIVPMAVPLQKKFARGVDYNLKLLLRGDRAAGKTALFNRLQVRQGWAGRTTIATILRST